jgi:hypothetical protein
MAGDGRLPEWMKEFFCEEQNMHKKRVIWAVVLALTGCIPALAANVYVNASATPPGDGLSWATAYASLTTAMASAPANSEIHVASGTYVPTVNTGFVLTNTPMTLYGGYNSASPSDLVRDPAVYVTTLSGDVNGNDVFADVTSDPCALAAACSPPNSHSENYRIMDLTNKTGVTIDGFTFKEGYTPLSGGAIMGGATGAFTLKNCVFTQNYAADGGGCIYNESGLVTATNCQFIQNSCYGRGSILYSYKGTVLGGTMTFKNCLFSINSTINDAGVLFLRNTETTAVIDCVFDRSHHPCYNAAAAGIYLSCNKNGSTTATLTVINTVFTQCKGAPRGSAVFQTISSGDRNNITVSSTLANCLVTGCQGAFTPDYDIGVYNSVTPISDASVNQHSSMTLINCTIANNIAPTQGALGVDCTRNLASCSADLALKNTIVWGNTGGKSNAQIFINTANVGYPRVTFTTDYCCLDNSDPNDYLYGATSPTTNLLKRLNGAPVVPAPNPQFDSAFFPGATSSCKNAGNSALLPADTKDIDGDGNTSEPIPFDLSGRPRIQATVPATSVDIGAYEYYLAGDSNGSGGVNLVDFEAMAAAWLDNDCGITNKWCSNTDGNHSGSVDMADYGALASQWLQ